VSNPAALLHKQLSLWLVLPGQTIRDVRLETAENDDHVMEQAQLAIMHIAAIEELLTGMESAGRKTRTYREAVPRWRATVMAYPSSWIHVQSAEAFHNENDLGTLENLDDVLEQLTPKYGDQDRTELRATLDGTRDALASDTSLPTTLRRHIYGLLDHASTVLDEYELFGDFELQKAVDRLLVSVNAAANVSKDRSKWRDLADKFVYPVMVGLAIQAPDSVAAMAAILPA
jgi:hypothetical protein